ncbi:manganese efflux pump MntP family protein [Methanobrevibacter sp. TMH8]|uniref:manganese efflux pump MntP n=1 Tax=Methanobrevibacter sp. TMH8 TaxID=2848611 RepID=UPI001CCAD5C3|nr:manganese efflux pump MntP family protein [Methanobrevibacter sp. TMH8]MBZ9571698.1 manganese efflux pump MntP family protein [Methanobrevibacter sp. TMH8]
MDLVTIILLAVALAMDAFSVSITKGFTIKNISKIQMLWFGIFFGGFQAIMPVLGWISGIQLEHFVSTVAPWIAFILLVAIGAKMIYESITEDEKEEGISKDRFSFKELTLLAIATSIDAFAVGVTFAILKIPILIPIILIGIVCFIFSEIGILIGRKIGSFFGNKFEIVGGAVLVLLGVRILLSGLGVI